MQQQYGWYSARAATQFGTQFWSTPEGNELEITHVSAEPTIRWTDQVNLGPVVDWIRDGRDGNGDRSDPEPDDIGPPIESVYAPGTENW